MSSMSTVPRMRERDDDSGDAPPPTSHAPPDRKSNESAVPLLAPAVGTWSSTASETNPLEGLPEEWQALGRKFDFTYTNIVCLMSTTPGHIRDETSLAVLATALESALKSKDWNRTQSLLCLLLFSHLYTVDTTIIIRLTALAIRAALASESDYQADFTSRLGMALVKPLAALVKQLSALECGDGGDWGGDGGTPEKLRLSAVVATPAATAAKSQLTSGRAPPETTGRGCCPQLASRNAPPETASVAQR